MVKYVVVCGELSKGGVLGLQVKNPETSSLDKARKIAVEYLIRHPKWEFTTIPIIDSRTDRLVGSVKRAMGDTGFIFFKRDGNKVIKWDVRLNGTLGEKW